MQVNAKIDQPQISTVDTLWQDIGFSAAEAAVLEVKHKLLAEIEKEISRRKLTRQELSETLGLQAAEASDLLQGKISRLFIDELTKCLRRLGRTIEIRTERAPALQNAKVG